MERKKDLRLQFPNGPHRQGPRVKPEGNTVTPGKLRISPNQIVDFTADDLADLGEIGRGAYGTVNRMRHGESGIHMAVKRIRCSNVEEKEKKKLLMDLEVVVRSSNRCSYIVEFFGAVFKDGDCWICMKLMDASLDQMYKFLFSNGQTIPENVLANVALATIHALSYLKEELKIIHRDVKPSNILLDRSGAIKLCDFGISGQLVDSIAESRDAGCRPYMSPERIDPQASRGYDVRSDVWSLGITLFEVHTGTFPYRKWNSVFEQLSEVVQGDPPRLKEGSEALVDFVNFCLTKEEMFRPKYSRLLQHRFLESPIPSAGPFLKETLEKMELHRNLENLSVV